MDLDSQNFDELKDPSNQDLNQRPFFFSFVKGFNESVEVPQSLSSLGVKADNIDKIVEGALKDPSRFGNPIEMTVKNTKDLLEECIGPN